MEFDQMNRRRFIGAAVTASILPSIVKANGRVERRRGASPKLAVCFGSGGLHGYAHIGAIRAFERLGVSPDIICGTSVGAVVGVLWAAGFEASEIEAIAGKRDWYGLGWPRIPKLGLGRLDELREALNEHIDAQRIEALPTRFAAVATDLGTGRPVILDRGEPGRVATASASVPLRYEPVTIEERQLLDGALTAPVPVDAARSLGADFCIAVDVAYRPEDEPVTGLSDVAFQTFHILINSLIDEQIRRADFGIRLDVHRVMREGGGWENLVQEAERATYQRRGDLIAALSQAGISLSANHDRGRRVG